MDCKAISDTLLPYPGHAIHLLKTKSQWNQLGSSILTGVYTCASQYMYMAMPSLFPTVLTEIMCDLRSHTSDNFTCPVSVSDLSHGMNDRLNTDYSINDIIPTRFNLIIFWEKSFTFPCLIVLHDPLSMLPANVSTSQCRCWDRLNKSMWLLG